VSEGTHRIMNTFLLYKNQDFDLQRPLPWNERALTQDLELNTLFNAMALGDRFLFEVARKAVLFSVTDVETILYRQEILQDCLKHPSIVRRIYEIAVDAIEREKAHYWRGISKHPSTILHESIAVLQMFMTMLNKLKTIADEHATQFESEGFAALFAMLKRELSDEYCARVHRHLGQLRFRDGLLISAQLGEGNKGTHYVLRKPAERKQNWLMRLFAAQPLSYTFTLHPRDESGARALSELKDRGINSVANALAQAADHMLHFFRTLRAELAFYVGCMNLHGQLVRKGEPISFPVPEPAIERRHVCTGLYDVCLSLTLDRRVVGNDVNGDKKDIVIITGANQGGKSTFLRSIGLAQLMMQCGMFVPAAFCRANICGGLFTHYKKEEDMAMKRGKLDEELSRMSEIVDNLGPNCMVLFNESFAATNEREGSEIAKQIISALLEHRIKIFFVTHLYQFAHVLYQAKMENALFLRAERQPHGGRSFKLIEGAPLDTSYGEDLYRKILVENRYADRAVPICSAPVDE
jgi:DNA mismatch repair ATPase MutS